MKTFKLTVTEDELKALIRYHAYMMSDYGGEMKTDTETSERIHTLTKRLNKDTPEIEPIEPAQLTAAKEEPPSSW